MNIPKVSICIPSYRQVEYLRQTLLSVQEQTFENYELIVSDDTPDERVSKLIKTFNFHGKLKYFHNERPFGSPENWNKAIRYAKGDYIKIMHHDDKFSTSGALAKFVQMLDDNPAADFGFGASLIESADGGRNRVHRVSEEQLSRLSIRPERLFLGNWIGAPSATIYRKSLHLEFDQRIKWLVDVDFYIRVLQQNPNFVYSPEILVITTNNAPHQVSASCQDNPAVDLAEHMLLYEKIVSFSRSRSDLWPEWFRLFEKYGVYSPLEFERLGLDPQLMVDVLMAYRRARLRRFPRRLKARAVRYLHKLTSGVRA